MACRRPCITASGTRASTDRDLVASWVEGLTSAHSPRNFEATTLRFLEALPVGLRDDERLPPCAAEHLERALEG